MISRNGRTRLLVLGIDGVPYRLVRDEAAAGTMPNLGELIRCGVFKPMSSSVPEISCVSWSSIITGENPGVHGIYGFTDVMPQGYGIRFPNFASLAAKPFWERQEDRRSVILNVPSTYPARPMNGIHVSGFVAPKLAKSVHPASLLATLEELDYRIDVDSQKGHESIPLFLEDLDRTLEARVALADVLWKSDDWDTFMLVFTGTDRLGHFLWAAYEDEEHPHHPDVLDHFRRVDRAIGRFVDRLGEDAPVVVLSDHGFERLEANVYVNRVLQEHGLLKLDDGRRGLAGIGNGSAAFALDPGRLYVHAASRFPRGSVAAREKEAVIEDLIELFTNLSVQGRRAIRSIHRRDELYAGPAVDRAPDVVLVGERGVNLKASFNTSSDGAEEPFTGKHSQPDAFLLVRSANGVVVPEKPSVVDVVDVLSSALRGGQSS